MNSKFFLVSMKPWAYDKEGDITLFSFCDFCLFELIFLSVNEYFPNGLKSKGHFGFSYQLLLKLPKVRRKKNTKHDFRAFFFSTLKIFETFQTQKKILVSTLINVSEQFQYFRSSTFFVKIATNYKTGSKHAIAIPLHQVYCLTCIYGFMKFYCPKVAGP